MQVKDIYLIEEHRFCTKGELCNAFQYQGPFLQYYQLLQRIPREWKQLLLTYPQGDCTPRELSPIRDENHPSKFIYSKVLQSMYQPEFVCREVWSHELREDIPKEEW